MNDSEYVDCWYCGGSGYIDHDCGEDTCCCLYPEDNVRCPECKGSGTLGLNEDDQ